jgi:hypothetical protein
MVLVLKTETKIFSVKMLGVVDYGFKSRSLLVFDCRILILDVITTVTSESFGTDLAEQWKASRFTEYGVVQLQNQCQSVSVTVGLVLKSRNPEIRKSLGVTNTEMENNSSEIREDSCKSEIIKKKRTGDETDF